MLDIIQIIHSSLSTYNTQRSADHYPIAPIPSPFPRPHPFPSYPFPQAPAPLVPPKLTSWRFSVGLLHIFLFFNKFFLHSDRALLANKYYSQLIISSLSPPPLPKPRPSRLLCAVSVGPVCRHYCVRPCVPEGKKRKLGALVWSGRARHQHSIAL